MEGYQGLSRWSPYNPHRVQQFVSSDFGSPVKTNLTTILYKSIFDMLIGFLPDMTFYPQKKYHRPL